MIRGAGTAAATAVLLGLCASATAASVCIDPGHGGYDPGAVGNGLYEDNLNLSAALAFRDWMNLDSTDGGGGGSWAVYMTRDTDVYVSLSGRSDYANSLGVDYFMCIHTNAGGGDGTETYAASSGTNSDSLAHRVQEEVVSHLGTTDRGVKYAGYSVLVYTNMPAELHEMVFIDVWAGNAALLADPANLDEVGLAHLHAIQRHVGLAAYTPSDCVPVAEVCNGADDDCDGYVDEDPNLPGCTDYFYDLDGDGYGQEGNSQCWCSPHGTYSAAIDGDCDDGDAAVNPEATELCDGLDNDCDLEVDDGDPVVMGVTVPEFAASLEDASYPSSVAAGDRAEVWVAFENVGSASWPAGSVGIRPEAAEMGETSDLYPAGEWPAWDVAAVLQQDVEPGETGVLSFPIQVPPDPGAAIVESFRLLAPGGERMNCPATTVGLDVVVQLGDDTTDSGSEDDLHAAQAGCRCRAANTRRVGAAWAAVLLILLLVSRRRARAAIPIVLLGIGTLTSPASAYDRNAAVSYSWTWCGSARNPAYCDYTEHGGDCANFVSQCIMEGGIYLGGWGCGGTQPSAGYLSDDLRAQGWESTYGCWAEPPANFRAGDVVIFYGGCVNYVPGSGSYCDFGHAVFAQTDDWSSGAWIGCASHTTDTCNMSYWFWSYGGCVEWLHYPDDCVPTQEVCDGVDNDCDGAVDEDPNLAGCIDYYHDGDGDGWGTDTSQCWCSPHAPYSASQAGDCDDTNAAISPAAVELCDGLDNDCNAEVDDGDPTVMGVVVPEYAATLVDASYPSSLEAGDRAEVWASFENVGLGLWPAGAVGIRPDIAEAGETSDLFAADDWLAWDVAALLDEDVAPGGVGVLVFSIEAPDSPGMVVEEPFRLVAPDGESMKCPATYVAFVVSVEMSGSDDVEDPDNGARADGSGCLCGTADRGRRNTAGIPLIPLLLVAAVLLAAWVGRRRRAWYFLSLFFCWGAVAVESPAANAGTLDVRQALTVKPVLSVILDTPGRLELLITELDLSATQQEALADLAIEERQSDRDLHVSGPPVHEWNERTRAIAAHTDDELRQLLGTRYDPFVEMLQGFFDEDAVRTGPSPDSRTCLSYTVFGTQYEAHTSYEVAIPDQYIKFANLGWQHYTGYPDSNYQVQLDRSGYSTTVWVGDVGPWNTDDNYWNPVSGTARPRRLFTDLPQGQPEAEQAYYYGYNGGLDQFGRTVGNPAGVDLAPDVATAIGLGYLQNDWITVTYLWECSCDGPCEPGQVEVQSCCDCGTQSRVCDDNCQWGGFSGCSGPDPNGGQNVCDTGEPGVCAEGRERCVAGCVECSRLHDPSDELCDDLDNDCNGETDDGDPTEMGETPPAYAALVQDGSYPRTLEPGSTASAWVEYINMGVETWEAGQIWFGPVGAADGEVSSLHAQDAWPSWDVAGVLAHDVEPGSAGYFTFVVAAPIEDGVDATSAFRPIAPDGELMRCPGPEFTVGVKIGSDGELDGDEDVTTLMDPDRGCSCVTGVGAHGVVTPAVVLVLAGMALRPGRRGRVRGRGWRRR